MGDNGIAQLCLNGHLITSTSNDIALKQNYCPACGQVTISMCDKCGTPIKGSSREISQLTPPFRYSTSLYFKPSYCYSCGDTFPWTNRSKEAAYELISFADDLNEQEKDDLKQSIEDLIKDTPKTSIAQVKFKKYATKAGTEIAKGLKDILIDLVSETVKKTVWGK